MMKFSLFAALLGLFGSAAAQSSLALDLNFKNAAAQISPTMLTGLETTLPGLISTYAATAAEANGISPKDLQKYLSLTQDVSITQKYDNVAQTSKLMVAFPNVPSTLYDVIKMFYTKVVQAPEVTTVLSTVVPLYLACNCDFESVGLRVENTIPTLPPSAGPAPTPRPRVGHIVGLKVDIAGQTQPVDPAVITGLNALLPSLLEATIKGQTTWSPATINLLLKLLSKVDIDGSTIGSVTITLPAIPATWVELYVPMVKKYIIDNASILSYAKTIIPTQLRCGSCTVTGWSVSDKTFVITRAPTTAPPTATPTAVPTNPPTDKPEVPDTGSAASLNVGLAALLSLASLALLL